MDTFRVRVISVILLFLYVIGLFGSIAHIATASQMHHGVNDTCYNQDENISHSACLDIIRGVVLNNQTSTIKIFLINLITILLASLLIFKKLNNQRFKRYFPFDLLNLTSTILIYNVSPRAP